MSSEAADDDDADVLFLSGFAHQKYWGKCSKFQYLCVGVFFINRIFLNFRNRFIIHSYTHIQVPTHTHTMGKHCVFDSVVQKVEGKLCQNQKPQTMVITATSV